MKKAKKIKTFSVNGVEITTEKKRLTVNEILLAAAYFIASYVDEDVGLENYVLTRVGGMKDGFRYSAQDRPVRLRDGDNFLAIYHGKTPVA